MDDYLWEWEQQKQPARTEETPGARRRRQERRRRERRRRNRRLLFRMVAVLLLLLVSGLVLRAFLTDRPAAPPDDASSQTSAAESAGSTSAAPDSSVEIQTVEQPVFRRTSDTQDPAEEVVSNYVLLIDMEDHTILTERDSNVVVSPASMTKILTLLVAAENIKDWTGRVTIDRTITDYCYQNDCSAVGYLPDETVGVRELFYGVILPSGADAALALANYVAGSQEAFVALMNEKIEELGRSRTAHFANCIGLYDVNHHCTIADMAVFLEAAMENDFCREVLSAHTYTTAKTAQHPDGITLSNWFLRRIEDKVTNGFEVLCAKTGYVNESGSCAASYAESADGHGYLCVTAMSTSSWRCIYDHVALYTPCMVS